MEIDKSDHAFLTLFREFAGEAPQADLRQILVALASCTDVTPDVLVRDHAAQVTSCPPTPDFASISAGIGGV